MTNYQKTTLYTGVSSDLPSRISEHKSEKYPKSFTAKYQLKYCVYYEILTTTQEAIEREKQVKKWRREKKDALMNEINPNWSDLWDEIKEWQKSVRKSFDQHFSPTMLLWKIKLSRG